MFSIIEKTGTYNNPSGDFFFYDFFLTVFVVVLSFQDNGKKKIVIHKTTISFAISCTQSRNCNEQLLGFEHLCKIFGTLRKHCYLLGYIFSSQTVTDYLLSCYDFCYCINIFCRSLNDSKVRVVYCHTTRHTNKCCHLMPLRKSLFCKSQTYSSCCSNNCYFHFILFFVVQICVVAI